MPACADRWTRVDCKHSRSSADADRLRPACPPAWDMIPGSDHAVAARLTVLIQMRRTSS